MNCLKALDTARICAHTTLAPDEHLFYSRTHTQLVVGRKEREAVTSLSVSRATSRAYLRGARP